MSGRRRGRLLRRPEGRGDALAEVGLEFLPHRSFALQVAYRWWNLETIDITGAPSSLDDLELTVDGFTVGGVVRF